MSESTPLRIGCLGAARIAPAALIRPARELPEVHVAAVAARDVERARRFASKHEVPRVAASYQELVEDPELDAIYVPLPNSHHCEWTLRALEAGKHVLCEKPLAANADEAVRMAEAAEKTGLVLVEAFHWRYHPLADRLREIIGSGELGRVRHVEASLCIPFALPGDIRYRWDLAGGAAMDVGCYPISIVRFLAGDEPEVVRAEVRTSSPRVDRYVRADLRFPDGPTGVCTGRITASLFSARILEVSARVEGERGTLSVFNPVAPHIYHHLRIRTAQHSVTERVKGDTTYTHQLRAFAKAVRAGAQLPTDAAHGVANMRVIDAIYEKAGLPRRGA